VAITDAEPLNPNKKRVDSVGFSGTSQQHTRVIVQVAPSEENVSFRYAVHSGAGGFVLENGARLIGTAYSNGNIQLGNNAVIEGDAFAVGELAGGRVLANAFTKTAKNCIIQGNIAYETSISGCTVSGTTSVATAPVMVPLTTIDTPFWRNQAASGGVIFGDHLALHNTSLGPKLITGSLIVENNASVTITGPLYVEGNIILNQNSSLTLHEGFGSSGTVVIAEQQIEFQNNTAMNNTSEGGTILFISTSNTLTTKENPAIALRNNGASIVLLAPSGMLRVVNNANLAAASAQSIHLDNNVVITYSTGLADSNFSTGPGATFELESWEHVKN
jgi:hypothetical protein